MILLSQILKNQFSLDQILNFLPVLLSAYFIIKIHSQKFPLKVSKKIMILLLGQFLIIFLTSTFIRFELKFFQKLLFPFYVPAFIVIPAACYVYLKSLTEEEFLFSKKDFIHFLPALILWVLLETISFPFFFGTSVINPENRIFLLKILSFLSIYGLIAGGIIQFGIYLVLGIRQYLRHQKKIKNYFSDIENIRLQWMKWFLIGYVLFLTTLIVSNLDTSTDKTLSDLLYLIVSILFISFIGYHSNNQKDIYIEYNSNPSLSPLPEEKKALSVENVKPTKKEVFAENTNESFTLSDQLEYKTSDAFYTNTIRQIELKNEIMKLLIDEKKYLNVSLSLDDIANELHTNKKYVSFVINSIIHTNFYNLVNEQRVQEAQKLISGKEGNQFTIEGIGNMAGFKSRSSFISAFKKHTGKTPSEFKQTKLNSILN